MRNGICSALGLSMLSCLACGDDSGSPDLLQSECVHEYLNLPRTISDLNECTNFGYTDCEVGSQGSECINYCAFDVCQAGPCTSHDDCLTLGTEYDCQSYVVSSTDYGLWCGLSECPRGTVGCPCLDGGCAEPSGWSVTCNAQDLCEGSDTCPAGCRSGSVCCGGAFCAGDCIGTPCC